MKSEFEAFRIDQAAKYLDKVRNLTVRVKSLQSAIKTQRSLAEGISGIDYSKQKTSSAASDDAIPNTVSRLVSMVSDLEGQLKSYEAEIARAHDCINKLDDNVCAACLEMYYIAGTTWAETAKGLHYSTAGIMSLRNRALNLFYEVMPVTEKTDIPEAI